MKYYSVINKETGELFFSSPLLYLCDKYMIEDKRPCLELAPSLHGRKRDVATPTQYEQLEQDYWITSSRVILRLNLDDWRYNQ